MIQAIQDIIWNIGGFIFTIVIFLFIIAFLFKHTIELLAGYHIKKNRDNLFYWIKNKKEINKIIEERKNGAKNEYRKKRSYRNITQNREP